MAVTFGIGAGVLMIAWSIASWLKLLGCTEPIRAYVVDYEDWGDSEGSEYRPIVEHRNQGEKYRHPVVVEAGKARQWVLEEVKQAYPVGKAITLYINPEKPKSCSLNPGNDKNDRVLFAAIGLILILIVSG